MPLISWNETNWKPRFFTIWSGQAISLFGSQLVQFALIWWLTQQTGSATVLATASLMGFLPQVFLGPFVGPLVDRWNRRWVMLVADGMIALVTILLAYLFAIGRAEIWTIYGLMFLRSLGGAFHWPSMSAATSLMVPKDQLTRVQGFNQMLQGALGIISAPLGALLVAWMSTQAILMIDVTTALFAIVPLLFIVIPEPVKKPVRTEISPVASFFSDLKDGFRYFVDWHGMLMIMILAMLINFLLNPAASLLPLLVTDHFGLGATELGWLESAFGLGMLAGGITLSVWGGFRKKIVTSMTGLIGLGVAFSMLGFLPSSGFIYAVASSFGAALMLPIVNGPIHAILQSAVEPDMQGRVFTLIGSLSSAMAPLGLLIAGPLADATSIQIWFVIAGAACALVGVAGFFIPEVMNIENNRKSVQNPDSESAPETAPAVPAL